ncbi:MAG: DPP IV N-terminal domain-containing protein [Bacteroidota bacterium]
MSKTTPNMTYRLFLLVSFLLLFVSTPSLQAQSQTLQISDIINPAHFPDRVPLLQWRADQSVYTQIDMVNQNLKQVDLKGNETVLVPLNVLKNKLGAELRRFPRIQWVDEQTFSFMHENRLLYYHLDTGVLEKITDIDPEAEMIEWGPKGVYAQVKQHNLYVNLNDSIGIQQLTDDGNYELTYGEAAHRYEFGIRKGMFWSPSGERLAFYRVDHRPVTDYPFVNDMAVPSLHEPEKYPMAGDSSHQASVGIYDVATGETIYLAIAGPAEQYLTNITWSPEGEYIYVAVVNRDQNYMELQRYSAVNGRLNRKLFDERQTKYVEPEHGPIFLPDNPEEFLWYSERSGFDHLYRYEVSGKSLGGITNGNWKVTDVLGFGPKGKFVYVQATKESPLERHIYKVDINKGSIIRLTPQAGTHRASLSADGKYILDQYSSLETPYVAQVIDTKKGEIVRTILQSGNPLADYQLGETKLFSLKANDGTDLYCRMILPPDFDSTKQYPVLTYVYGGPHAQLVTNTWMGGSMGRWIMLMNYFASQGYVVFTLDNRGSAHRGLAFEQAVFRKLGTLEIQDQLVGVSYLKQKPWIDADRMGVLGWSYGGFMTTSLMLRAPGTFQVGVAGGPVIDWRMYEVMYTERYMDTPQSNSEGYDKANLVQYVDQLQGDLLLIQGLQDATVVPQHSYRLLREAVDKNVQIDFYPYMIYEHHVRGKDNLHLLQKIFDYFDSRLGE